MNYLFVYNNGTNIGGVQTLIARFAEGVIAAGDSATALFLSEISDGVASLLPRQCEQMSLPAKHCDSWLFPLTSRSWLRRNCGKADICITFGKTPLQLVAANLFAFHRWPAVVSYVVNDSEFVRTQKKVFNCLYSYIFFDKYFRDRLPDANKYFMSEAVLRIHAEGMRTSFSGAQVVPLPIKVPESTCQAILRPMRLVSIGRIDSTMKTYNFTVPRIIRELHDDDVDIRWDIYGGGPPSDVKKLQEVIEANRVSDRVTWHGELPYAEMNRVLTGATAFLGMGTAAIEAAMHGIPAIVAVANAVEPICYGFLHELPFGMCGEAGVYWVPKRSIKQTLLSMHAMSSSEFTALVNRETSYSQQYEFGRIVAEFQKCAVRSCEVAAPPFPLRWTLLMCLNNLRFHLKIAS